MSRSHTTTTKRLLQELKTIAEESKGSVDRCGPIRDDEFLHWSAVLLGVEGSAYEGGRWLLDIKIPDTYPLAPPTMRFLTPICHPNVHFQTGEICLDLLKTSWSPAYTIASTLDAVRQLLTSAEPDSPLNVDIAQLFRQGDDIGAQALIGFYTRLYVYHEK